MRPVRGLPELVGTVLLAVACGSDPAPIPAPLTDSDSERLGILEKCRAFAERLCESAEPCCSTRAPFASEDCVDDFVRETCNPVASIVAEGHATYDESAEEACLLARSRSFATCVADWEEIVALRRDVWSECKVVRGTREPGESCDAAAMCALPDGAASVACVRNVCRVLEILGEGAECPFPNGDVSVCDVGLYCTSTVQDELGTCEPAVPIGGACDPTNLENPACGLGNYCDLTAGVCRRAVNFGGPSCDQGTECVSFDCDRVGRTCAEPLRTAEALCGEP